MKRLFSAFVIALILALSLAACGKKGSPKPPSGDSQYPQQYPKQQ
jgi:predicted small lipoprotein YifL